MNENEVGEVVLDAASNLHRESGPGLLESVYGSLLAHVLAAQGFRAERRVPVTVSYRGRRLDEGFRADLIIERKAIVELKSVEKIHPPHRKQVLTYLRLSGLKPGYLLNLGEAYMRDGITRVVNRLEDSA